jgi:flagellar motor component MotA
MAKTQVDNMGEALDVFIQTAKLAQRSGILTLEDAVIVKSAIDFVQDRIKESMAGQSMGQPQISGSPEEAEANTAEAQQ